MRKFAAIVLTATLFLAVLTGCTPKWCVKYGDVTVRSDVFNYYACTEYNALTQSGQISADRSLDEQEINGVSAEEYIRLEALDRVLYLCELTKRFKGAGLSISEETFTALSASAKNEYASHQSLFSKHNVSEDAVLEGSISGKMGHMQQLLFDSTYGAEGSQAVSDDELNDFYQNNYICYSYVYQRLSNADGTALSENDSKGIKNELKKLSDNVKSGAVNIDDTAIAYATDYAEDNTCGKNGVTTTTSVLGTTDIMIAAKQLKAGEVTYLEIGGYAFVLQRHDLSATNFISDNRYSVLVEMKLEPFKEEILSAAKSADYSVKEGYINSVMSKF